MILQIGIAHHIKNIKLMGIQAAVFNNYVRRKQLWYYISGVTAKPKWTEWMSGGAIRILEGDV